MNAFYPSLLQWVGIAKETVPGTAMAVPTAWIPVDAPTYISTIKPLVDQNLRGTMVMDHQQQQGSRHDEVKYKTYVYLDSVMSHFIALLGNPDTITGSADPYTHKTAVYNGSGTNAAQPPTYTLFIDDAAGHVQQVPGCVASEVKLTIGADMLCSLDVAWIGLAATAITPPANTPSTVKPMPAWNSTISIGGVAATQYSSIEIDFKRDVSPIITITGNQSPFAIFGGGVSLTGSLNAVYQGTSDVNWTNFLTNGQPALVVKCAPPGDATHALTITCSVMAYDVSSYSGTNKFQEIKSTIKALGNATDALSGSESPVQVSLTTPQSTAF